MDSNYPLCPTPIITSIIQIIKIEIAQHLVNIGYRTGNPYANWICALDVFFNKDDIPLDDYDYVGSVSFNDDHCVVTKWTYGTTIKDQSARSRQTKINYSEPDLFEIIEKILRDGPKTYQSLLINRH